MANNALILAMAMAMTMANNGNGKHCNGSATSTAGFELQAALKAVKGLRFKATLSIVRRQISHDSPPLPTSNTETLQPSTTVITS